MTRLQFESTRYWRVPWASVPALVRARRALLRGGLVYVSQADFVAVVAEVFRANLQEGLAVS